ncbi:hypothetical protein HK098_001014 [Nowakowskiella sp. JEL0407]|nr:hypothetical protein HK098_001014 [Nowakowskiella sp. JEL0407]
METLKLYNELFVMSTRLPIPFLTHFFKSVGWCKLSDASTKKDSDQDTSLPLDLSTSESRGTTPTTAKFSSLNLASTIQNFHLSELESADYRSAYHQVCDWLYGWNVTDVTDYHEFNPEEEIDPDDLDGVEAAAKKKTKEADQFQSGDDAIIEHHFKMKRVPRDINLSLESEKAECERIVKTFETLYAVSRRTLKRIYLDIEEMIPRIGHGIRTMKNNHSKFANAMGKIGKKAEKFDDEDDDEPENSQFQQSDVDVEQIWAKKDFGLEFLNGGSRDRMNEKVDSVLSLESLDLDDNPTDARVLADGVFVRKKVETENIKKETETNANEKPPKEESSNQTGVPSDVPEIKVNSTSAPTEQAPISFNFFPGKGLTMSSDVNEDKISKHRDLNILYREIDKSTEYTLVCVSCAIVVLSFSQLLESREKFAKYTSFVSELASEFVSSTLKTFWDVLNHEIPNQVSLSDIRHPHTLLLKIRQVIKQRAALTGRTPRLRISKIHRKFALLHELFSSVDIHLFPQFIWAHKEGCKIGQYSTFSSSIWLTAGYDSVVRIHDLSTFSQSGNSSEMVDSAGTPMTADLPGTYGRSCLAQYVGHRSIVTDAKFLKDDSHLVSCSFDRTVKIWNSQNATCEKTLTGHTDAVTTCDVTPDSRIIASGSVDGTVRIHDSNSGDCITVLKKHTRWVKVVRFSYDGKYLLTGGLDRKIYLWDTKFLVNAKNITHTRCIESHTDYILDLATTKPNILVSTSRDSTVRVSDFTTGHELHLIDLAPSWACSVAFCESGEFFATGSFDNTVSIFRTNTGERVRQIRIFNLGILSVRFPKDLSCLVVGTTEGFLQRIPL